MSGILRKVDRLGRTFGSERRRVDALTANKYNAKLFPDSLAPASVALLAEDLEARGLEVPVRVMTDGTIVDGERRCLAAKSLGWVDIDVVVGPMLTDEELLDRVIGACTSARQMTVREQVNIYVAVSEQYRRDSGRSPGRPASKTNPIGERFLEPEEIAQIAATKAGFTSVKTAERSAAVFTRGSAALQAQVLNGKLAISAAYNQIPKQVRRAKPVAPELNRQQVICALSAAEPSASNAEPSPGDDLVQSRLLTAGEQDAVTPPRPLLPSGEETTLEANRCAAPRAFDDEGARRTAEKNPADEQLEPASEQEPAASPETTAEDPVSDAERAAAGHTYIPIEPVEVERAFDRACTSLIDLIQDDPEAVKKIAGRVGRRLREVLKLLP